MADKRKRQPVSWRGRWAWPIHSYLVVRPAVNCEMDFGLCPAVESGLKIGVVVMFMFLLLLFCFILYFETGFSGCRPGWP